jgi:alpha-L-rhamnosidase
MFSRISNIRGALSLLLSFALLGTPAFAASIRPTELRCEYAVNPLGIDVAQPRLSWQVVSPERSQKQTAYQIHVFSRSNLISNSPPLTPDLWDSGKIISDETRLIPYGGKPVPSSEQAFWTVRVWDQNDQPSAWADFQTWTMGLLTTNDWKAKWICAPATSESLLLRKEFSVKPGLRRAIAHVTGLGQYEMSLNGKKVSADLLTPGWTDYNDTILYDTRDITQQLRTGANAVGLTLGNGMYHVERRNRFAKFTGSFGPQRAICQIELEYADGSKEFVITDESWRVHPGAITYNSIYGGEDFDARLYPHGWNEPEFDDATWKPAVAVVRPAGKLRGHSAAAEPLREIEVRDPFQIVKLSDTTLVYDFGQNASYMPRLRVSGPAGSTVRLIPAEVINPDGTIQRSTMGSTNRGISWWQYTLGNPKSEIQNPESPIETWFPQFFYVGCRYLQVELVPPNNPSSPAYRPPSPPQMGRGTQVRGQLPRIESLEGVIVHSTSAPVGNFECSNPLLNQIHGLVRWAQRANMVSVLTDCPHREKLGWLEQYHLNGPAIRYEFDLARMFTKGMNDMADAQTAEGLVPNVAPEYVQFSGAFRAAAEWSAAFIAVPWQQYHFHADVDLLRQHYPAMKRYFAWLEKRAVDDIVSDGLGDWYDLGPQRLSRAELTPPPVTATAFYFQNAQLLSKIAGLLGHADEAKTFAAKGEQIRASYHREFFTAETGSYATGSQCANALPLVLGIVPPEHRTAVFAALLKDLEANDGQMTAGDVGFRYLLQALAQHDRSDLIYRMINQDEKPGYGYMLKMGATTLTESWNAKLTASHNHFMLGHINEWFYKDLAGLIRIRMDRGSNKIIIKPQPAGDLTWAKASYNSARGKISSEWRRTENQFQLKVHIPANTTATVLVPAQAEAGITEGGRPVAEAAGVKFLRQENGRAVFRVASGAYEFSAPVRIN